MRTSFPQDAPRQAVYATQSRTADCVTPTVMVLSGSPVRRRCVLSLGDSQWVHNRHGGEVEEKTARGTL